MSVVPNAFTPLDDVALAKALYFGYARVFGEPPTGDVLRCAYAQTALETGKGAKMRQYNFGNITAGAWKGDVYTLVAKERVRRNPDVWEDRTLSFRAYPSDVDGAADYWAFLVHHYPKAWTTFLEGDAFDAAMVLGAEGYFTAKPLPYATAMRDLALHFDAELGPALAKAGLPLAAHAGPGAPSPMTDEDWAVVENESGAAACSVVETVPPDLADTEPPPA